MVFSTARKIGRGTARTVKRSAPTLPAIPRPTSFLSSPRRGAATAFRSRAIAPVPAAYAAGFGQLDGFKSGIKKFGRGVKKTAKAVVKAPVVVAKTTAKTAAKAPSFGAKVGKFAVQTATLPHRTALAFGRSVATTGAKTIGKAAGQIVKTPLDVGKAVGKGFISPFKKKKKTAQEELEAARQAAEDAEVRNEARRIRDQTKSGSGYESFSPDYGGGATGPYGGGDGGPYDLEQQQPLLQKAAGMSTQTKLLLAGGAAIGAFFIYRAWRGGARRSGGPKS
jgi:hypothetical protein